MENSKNILMSKMIAASVEAAGGRAYYVGGFVRDRLLGRLTKDIDMEIHKLEPDKLEAVLDSLGNRLSFGASFGIYALSGYDIDIALPRKETNSGKGHRDFLIEADPELGTFDAARRRDFTINAIMEDVLTGEIVDHFNGQKDLQAGVLRHIDSATFPEDPLRVLRCAQFAARFGFTAASETVELCKKIDISALASERVYDELKKAMLKSEQPSFFFSVLNSMDQLGVWFDELQGALVLGDARLKFLDQASSKRLLADFDEGFMLAALSFMCESEKEWECLIKRLTSQKKIHKYVKSIRDCFSELEALEAKLPGEKTDYEYNRIFDRCVCPADLILMYRCFHEKHEWEKLCEKLEAFNRLMQKPFVQGRDLIEEGFAPGEELGQLVSVAHELRLKGFDKEKILKMTKSGSKRT